MSDLQLQDIDQKKKFLKRYKKNLALIGRLENRLINLNERIYAIKSSNFSAMPKGNKSVDISDLISDKDELEARISRLKKKGSVLKGEILDVIDRVDDVRYAEVLEAFFIDCKTFEEMSEDMGYTMRHIVRLYTEAVNSVSL